MLSSLVLFYIAKDLEPELRLANASIIIIRNNIKTRKKEPLSLAKKGSWKTNYL